MTGALFFTLWYLVFWNKALNSENLRKTILKEFLEISFRSLCYSVRTRGGYLFPLIVRILGPRFTRLSSVFLHSSFLRRLVPIVVNLGFFIWRIVEYSIALKGSHINNEDVLLDIGSRYSCFPSYLASQSYTISLDIDRNAMDFQNKVSKIMSKNISKRLECVIADATRLPFRDYSFDKIFIISTIEHVLRDSTVAEESGRVLREEGCCIMSFPFSKLRKEPLTKPYFQRFYTRKMIVDRIVTPSKLSLGELSVFGKNFLCSFYAVVPEGWFIFKDLVLGLSLLKLEEIFLSKDKGGTLAVIKLYKNFKVFKDAP